MDHLTDEANEQFNDKIREIIERNIRKTGGTSEEPGIREEEPPLSEEIPSAEPVAEEPVAEEPVAELPVADMKDVIPPGEVPAVPEDSGSASKKVWPKETILARSEQAERNVMDWISIYGSKYDQLEFAFNYVAGQNKVHVVYDESEVPEELWFIGDVHGDILALDAALAYIDAHSTNPSIVFLGDLFDRFDYGKEVLMRVISLIRERPGKILWIAGNHDDGLFYQDGMFKATVSPAEFVDYLNSHPEYTEFGQWLTGLCGELPRALFLPDGLFIAHGGCMSFDMNSFSHAIDDVKSLDDLETPEALRTFVWNRVIPDQDDKSESEVGKNDLIHFMNAMEKLIGYPVKRMLRGHDHCEEERYKIFDHYEPEAPVLTMTTMSAWYLGTENSAPEMSKAMRKKEITTPAIARYRYGALPEVINLEIPKSVVEQFHKVESLEK